MLRAGSTTRLAMVNPTGGLVASVTVFSVYVAGLDLTGSASEGHPHIGPWGSRLSVDKRVFDQDSARGSVILGNSRGGSGGGTSGAGGMDMASRLVPFRALRLSSTQCVPFSIVRGGSGTGPGSGLSYPISISVASGVAGTPCSRIYSPCIHKQGGCLSKQPGMKLP